MSGCQEEAAAITYGMEKMKFQIWEYIHTDICSNCDFGGAPHCDCVVAQILNKLEEM